MTPRPRILVVDDEEAILETMTFTFEDDYEVLTSPSPREALGRLEREGRVAVVISDQRMPEMTGVEFLARVFALHPTTVRMILTGFADMDATIGAINDGHVYAYVTKPWDQDELKQVVASLRCPAWNASLVKVPSSWWQALQRLSSTIARRPV